LEGETPVTPNPPGEREGKFTRRAGEEEIQSRNPKKINQQV